MHDHLPSASYKHLLYSVLYDLSNRILILHATILFLLLLILTQNRYLSVI
jgi:hypothetical protein